MTEDRTRQIVQHAADAAVDRGGHRRMWIALVCLVLCVAGGAAWFLLQLHNAGGRIDALSAASRRNAAAAIANARVAHQLADQVTELGAVPVARPPSAPQPGPTGPAGRGITSTTVSDGHLIVAYSDGTTQDVGRVVGKQGPRGDDGRSISGTSIADGHLIVAYSDGTTQDAGAVVGPRGDTGPAGPPGEDGRSVISVVIDPADYHLIVTYSDGATVDAGALPPGPPGSRGKPGPQGVSVTDVQFGRDDDGQCQTLVTLHNPATGQDRTVTHPAGQAACTVSTPAPGQH